MDHLRNLIKLFTFSTIALASSLAIANTYPNKPIKAIVPFAPGSATDQIGRAFAAKMSDALGQPVVVENRPGANGMIGADIVAKAPADGYTLLFGTNSTNAALKSLVKTLPYNQDTAFTPIGYFGSVPLIVAINNDVPAKSLNGLVSLARAEPGKITFAYASTSQRVSSEMLASMEGIKMTGVSYKSGPNAMTDLIGGQVNMFTADFAVTLPQVQAGKIRGLAVTSLKRSPAIPELPTVNEALGIKNYELIAFFAAFGPTGMPKDIILKLNKAINEAAKSKELTDRFSAMGFESQPGSPEMLDKKIKLETMKWAKAIKEAGMQPD
ncbi:tripartite tricarboxylate transporter substrate binding protein [Polynucleobacter sp. UK-Mo-2m-Kol15]|uniref:Bug family tripartite tricarboxylate transporter substrate binding protein n=1 Tax=Polynucleobacter sp. UK-Mo-2m-Kol15 TaxID=2576916 RepID=UPI001C0D727F|nr:tripartite tricarboxylate transporter substrate binding protein [Polynucleobacter sp. UK-Mo-2m-Kol15]MBU3575057.1 tripartite tricarboxylate transporter substrate binding protein [Polynucleobacter sp. UK-Mo-2m-Kol15]